MTHALIAALGVVAMTVLTHVLTTFVDVCKSKHESRTDPVQDNVLINLFSKEQLCIVLLVSRLAPTFTGAAVAGELVAGLTQALEGAVRVAAAPAVAQATVRRTLVDVYMCIFNGAIEDVRTKSTYVTFAKFDPHFTKSLKASKCKRVNSKYFHEFLLNTFAH